MRIKIYKGKNIFVMREKDKLNNYFLIKVLFHDDKYTKIIEFKTTIKPSSMSRNFKEFFKLLDENYKSLKLFNLDLVIPDFFNKSLEVKKFFNSDVLHPKVKFMGLIDYFDSESEIKHNSAIEENFKKYVECLEFVWKEANINPDRISIRRSLAKALCNPIALKHFESFGEFSYIESYCFDFNVTGKEEALRNIRILEFIILKNKNIEFKDFLRSKENDKSPLNITPEIQRLSYLSKSVEELNLHCDFLEELTPKQMIYYLYTDKTWINLETRKELEPKNLDDYYSYSHLQNIMKFPSLGFFSEKTCNAMFKDKVYSFKVNPYMIKTINSISENSHENAKIWLKVCPAVMSDFSSFFNDNENSFYTDMKDFTNEALKEENSNIPFAWLLEMQSFRNSRVKELINEKLNEVL